KYTIGIAGNGGMRLVVDGQTIIEELNNRRTRSINKEIALEAGRSYDLRLEYFENGNQYSAAKLNWSPPTGDRRLKEDALAKSREADAVVMVVGITPSVEGEEMDVKVEGFR